jgi:hypothetical protein
MAGMAILAILASHHKHIAIMHPKKKSGLPSSAHTQLTPHRARGRRCCRCLTSSRGFASLPYSPVLHFSRAAIFHPDLPLTLLTTPRPTSKQEIHATLLLCGRKAQESANMSSGLMPDAMKPKVPDTRPRKKKGRKNLVITFDPEARKEYLTGFSKRKLERREKAR